MLGTQSCMKFLVKSQYCALGSVQNMTQGLGVLLCCLRVDARRNARLDLNSILAFLCVVFLCLVTKKSLKFEYFQVS